MTIKDKLRNINEVFGERLGCPNTCRDNVSGLYLIGLGNMGDDVCQTIQENCKEGYCIGGSPNMLQAIRCWYIVLENFSKG